MKVAATLFSQTARASAALVLTCMCLRADIMYVWSDDGTIRKFDSHGVGSLFTTNNLSGWNGAVGLALDNVGNLYAGVPGQSHIWKFLLDGTIGPGHEQGIVDSVSALAFDDTGTLFATLPNYAELCRPVYELGWGWNLWSWPTNYTQSHLVYPSNLAFDRAGRIFVANGGTGNSIETFSKDFTHLGSFTTGLSAPWGLAFDANGNLFVADSATNGTLSLRNAIFKFTPEGVRSTYTSGLNNPRGLAFDSAGNLYVANAGDGTILRVYPNASTSVFASGLNRPTSIAFFPGLQLWSAAPILLRNPKITTNALFQLEIQQNPGLGFRVLGTTNVGLPTTSWSMLGTAIEVVPGLYQFTDSESKHFTNRFYRLVAP
jgi:hypothetical protein